MFLWLSDPISIAFVIVLLLLPTAPYGGVGVSGRCVFQSLHVCFCISNPTIHSPSCAFFSPKARYHHPTTCIFQSFLLFIYSYEGNDLGLFCLLLCLLGLAP